MISSDSELPAWVDRALPGFPETSEPLRNWIRQAEADHGERDDRKTTSMLEENRRLAKENAELRRVSDVLRAASAFFVSEIDATRSRS